MNLKYCLSLDNGATWQTISGTTLRDAKRAAQIGWPVVIYGPVHQIGMYDTDAATRKIKLVARRKAHFNKRATWINYV